MADSKGAEGEASDYPALALSPEKIYAGTLSYPGEVSLSVVGLLAEAAAPHGISALQTAA